MTNPLVSSIPQSTVPAVKVWLQKQVLANVVAEPGYGLTVCLDDPGVQQSQDIISVQNVHRRAEPYQMIGSFGAGSTLETYELHVVVSVFRGGPDQAWPWTRAWALASIVEAVVRSDPTCGGVAIQAHPKESHDTSQWEMGHKG